jgi:hypothetical protein
MCVESLALSCPWVDGGPDIYIYCCLHSNQHEAGTGFRNWEHGVWIWKLAPIIHFNRWNRTHSIIYEDTEGSKSNIPCCALLCLVTYYAPDSRRIHAGCASHPRIRRKCCAHILDPSVHVFHTMPCAKMGPYIPREMKTLTKKQTMNQ